MGQKVENALTRALELCIINPCDAVVRIFVCAEGFPSEQAQLKYKF